MVDFSKYEKLSEKKYQRNDIFGLFWQIFISENLETYHQTRMHSSRMRTIRCSSRLPAGAVFLGGCLPEGCLPRDDVCLGCVCLGVSAHGCLPEGGVSAWGRGVCLTEGCLTRGVCLGDVSAQGGLPRGSTPLLGMGVSDHGGVTSPLGTEFLTHACENITFPQLRFPTVIMHHEWKVKMYPRIKSTISQ